MNLDVCKDFQIKETQSGLLLVTPFEYEDHDKIVVFAERRPEGRWLVHDNGDAALRLMFDSVSPDSARIRTWLSETTLGIEWDDKNNQLQRIAANEDEIVRSALKVAQAAAQMQAMVSHRVSREESTFKEEVLKLLKEVSEETGVEAKFDVPVDQKRLFNSDCLFLVPDYPLSIFVATSTERLLEAELAWSELRRAGDPTRVFAVVEDAKQVGLKQVERADYFTDKTYRYRDWEEIFRDAVKRSVKPEAATH
ncbi:MAG: DUF1828 domain-containing protein [Betaproteobacteria bacterium]|nr:DUF1828 domain-containing protein [Betaproteobacteria bacterium]